MHRIALALPLVVTVFPSFGCATRPDPSPPVPEVYAVALQVPTPANLPACGAALSGTTAFVAAPAGLWTCQRTTWLPIPCTTLIAGAVAYASATNTLFACSSGQWAPVALPAGSTGPQGDPGPAGDAGATSRIVVGPEPSGANCATGGVRVEVGIDTDGNGALDAGEVQQTAYVCNGAPGAPDPDAGAGGTDGGSAGDDAGDDAGGSPCGALDCSNDSSGHVCISGNCGCNSPSDCPTGTACNTTTHVCATSCGGPAQCNGGCCHAGVCVGGDTNVACGTGGAICRQCPNASACSNGVCVACAPFCPGGTSCGAPDGCGGTCGSTALCCGGIVCADPGFNLPPCCTATDQCGVVFSDICVSL